jgi:hypothetical protein
MMDSLVNSVATEVFTPEGTTHPAMGMPHAQMVSHAYGYHKRPWVGLTRMELIKCGVLPFGMSYELYEAIEAKLKEKNT